MTNTELTLEEMRVADTGSARIDVLVERFLTWSLPDSVCADPCVTKSTYRFPRSGTNLLTAAEAREMIEHLLDGISGVWELPANRGDVGEPKQAGWRDIESAPKDGTEIDLWTSCGIRIADVRWGQPTHANWGDRYGRDDGLSRQWVTRSGCALDRRNGCATHWMPKPLPPSKQEVAEASEGKTASTYVPSWATDPNVAFNRASATVLEQAVHDCFARVTADPSDWESGYDRACNDLADHFRSMQGVQGSTEDQPGDVNKLIEQEAFNRGLEAALKAAAAASTDTSNDEPAAASAQTKICIFRDRMLSAIRSLKNTGETGDEKQDGELNDTNLAELQRLGQEFDAAPDLSETESAGDGDVEELAGRLEYRASKMYSDKADLMREAATALKTIKAERDELEQRIFTECAASNSYAAKCDSLTKKVERLEDLLRDATFPTHGDRGGPLCSVKAEYEDGSEASKGHEPNRDARAALADEGE